MPHNSELQQQPVVVAAAARAVSAFCFAHFPLSAFLSLRLLGRGTCAFSQISLVPGFISRQTAEGLLRGCADTTFLIRFKSDQPGYLVFSRARQGGPFVHYSMGTVTVHGPLTQFRTPCDDHKHLPFYEACQSAPCRGSKTADGVPLVGDKLQKCRTFDSFWELMSALTRDHFTTIWPEHSISDNKALHQSISGGH